MESRKSTARKRDGRKAKLIPSRVYDLPSGGNLNQEKLRRDPATALITNLLLYYSQKFNAESLPPALSHLCALSHYIFISLTAPDKLVYIIIRH